MSSQRAPVNLHGLGSSDFERTTVTGFPIQAFGNDRLKVFRFLRLHLRSNDIY